MTIEFLSKRIQAIQPSPTLAISARAGVLQRQGKDIISLSVGEPDFPVFPHVAKAIEEALYAGKTRYTASAGVPELREAIAATIRRDLGLHLLPAQVMATAGAKQALFNACQALLDEGDECIVPNPYWVSYPEMARLAGARVVELHLRQEDRWVPRAEELEKLITERTRVLMIGSPSNPTGAVCPGEVLRELAAVLRKHPRIVVLSDDIYEKLTFGGRTAPNLVQVAPDLAPRTVLVNGCSKSYAMTGLRLGWAAGPLEIIAAMCKVQDASTSNPSSLSQAGAIAALTGPQALVEEMRRAFEERRDLLVDLVRAVPGLRCEKSDGAFYLFADVSGVLGKRHRGEKLGTSQRLAEVLLEEYGVAVVPGTAFGRDGFVRFSFANSIPNLRKAMERISAAVKQLE